jgi:hypothetical protein
MLDFFMDLKELEMLPKPSSEKYPSEDVAQFILSYILGRSFPFEVDTAYSKIGLRATILGSLDPRLMDLAQGQS